MSAKAAELQREVRENAEDYQSYLKSLYKWEEEIKVKDEALKAAKKPAGNQVVWIFAHTSFVIPFVLLCLFL